MPGYTEQSSRGGIGVWTYLVLLLVPANPRILVCMTLVLLTSQKATAYMDTIFKSVIILSMSSVLLAWASLPCN